MPLRSARNSWMNWFRCSADQFLASSMNRAMDFNRRAQSWASLSGSGCFSPSLCEQPALTTGRSACGRRPAAADPVLGSLGLLLPCCPHDRRHSWIPLALLYHLLTLQSRDAGCAPGFSALETMLSLASYCVFPVRFIVSLQQCSDDLVGHAVTTRWFRAKPKSWGTLADAIGVRRRRSPEYFEPISFPVWKREQYFQPTSNTDCIRLGLKGKTHHRHTVLAVTHAVLAGRGAVLAVTHTVLAVRFSLLFGKTF